ncbi:MAG: TfoX/Sxy family protein [Prevotella sp.]|nr:TfoX/Sxy family protein [Prevotella sp.]
MPCSSDYIDFVRSQLSNYNMVRIRKMMGEYLVYVNEKCVLLVCDDLCYVKKIPELKSLMSDAECGFPYPGAKKHYILDIEHQQQVRRVIDILCAALPYPTKRKQK